MNYGSLHPDIILYDIMGLTFDIIVQTMISYLQVFQILYVPLRERTSPSLAGSLRTQGESVSNANKPNWTAGQRLLVDKLTQSRWHGCRAGPGCVGGFTGQASATVRLGLATWSGPRQASGWHMSCLSSRRSECQCESMPVGRASVTAGASTWKYSLTCEHSNWRSVAAFFHSFASEMKFLNPRI